MAGQNPGSPTDFQYFYEDEVYKINNRGQVVFGLVLENFEANSSDQESDVETAIQKGEIRVVWHPSGNERVISEKTVGLADRSLMPGDVVRRLIAGKDTQRGYCRDIIMTADLQIVGTNHVIPGVASERLHPLEEFTPDLAVCLDSWVGTSKSVHCNLHLAAADGSRLIYPDLDTSPLKDCTMRRRRTSPYAASEYYPGQVVAGPLFALEHANWTNITKEMKAARKHEKRMLDHKFTVEAVVTDSVAVHWQCRALSTSNTDSQQPRYHVEGEDLKRLKLLNVFEPCTLQVGDRNYLTINETDIFIPKKQWRKQQSKSHRTLRRQTRPRKTSKDCVNQTNQAGDLPPPKHVPSKPKKRASSFHNRESKTCPAHNENKTVLNKQSEKKDSPEKKLSKDLDSMNQDMDVDSVHQPMVIQDAEMKEVDCPSINIVPSDEMSVKCQFANFGSGNSTSEDVTIEEKNDSGISPEPTKEDSSFIVNGNYHSTDPSIKIQDDMSEHWENTSSDEGTDTDSGATWSSRYSSANSLASGGAGGVGTARSGKRSPQLAIKFLRGKRLKRAAKKAQASPPPAPGARVVVETLYTTSKANVVWQDGTIEVHIPSTDLYPIHHLDGQECFPGDFVISGTASDETDAKVSHREYGVVQKVDHHGRTAIVKWYKTYTTSDEPLPVLLREAEVSVYDLKDHPDFQYRPGTVVIRVANFSGEDAACTAGQVIDNFPEGRVKVWWVDGHTSMCWPQDLYKVGEYDSEEGELWGEDGDVSDSSWETQSEGPGSGSRDELEPTTPLALADVDADDTTGDAIPPTTTEDVRVFLSSLSKAVNGLENNLERMVGEHATSGASLSIYPALKDLEGPIICMSSRDLDTGSADTQAEPDYLGLDSSSSIPQLLEPRVASHIERGRRAMRKLEEMFAKDPKLQNRDVMCKLLNLYKGCRFLDRLMGTTFFHEDNFLDLVERVRSRKGMPTASSASTAPTAGERRVHDQVTRLFSTNKEVENKESKSVSSDSKNAPQVLVQDSLKYKEVMETAQEGMDVDEKETSRDSETTVYLDTQEIKTVEDVTQEKDKDKSTELISSGAVDTECSQCDMSAVLDTCFQRNAGKGNADKTALTEVDDIVDYKSRITPDELFASGGAAASSGVTVRNVCYELCSLIHLQLGKAHAEVSKRKPQLWAHFLNKTMTEQKKHGQKLTYHFSVHYGSLVVSIDEKSERKKSESSIEMEEFEDAEECQDTAEEVAAVAQCDAKQTKPVATEENKTESETREQNTKGPETIELDITEPVTVAFEAGEGFAMLESAPTAHRFRASILPPSEIRAFSQAVQREIKLLKKDLPAMVWVRGYEDRMDLLSLMVGGPTHTPYEDGLFLFDVQLGGEFPRAPPLCHYISYCSDRLNPNLYEDGKVCVSLLGTWSGRGVEVWGKDSSLLQVIVSLQGLILNAEPYFNEAGYEKQKGSQQGRENSRMYNEMVVLKLVQSMTKLVLNPPEVFREEIMLHLKQHASSMCSRLQHWMIMSEKHSNANSHIQSETDRVDEQNTVSNASQSSVTAQTTTVEKISDSNEIQRGNVPPEFPLIPASRGFCLTLKSSLDAFRNALKKCGVDSTEPL